MSAPLTGIRIVELSTMVTGSFTGMMLADLGADVIKIENPAGGDPFRNYGGASYGPNFCAYNRNKRSMALDLRAASDVSAFERLLASSDVLLDNFRPGVLERLGFDQARIKHLNPMLVWASITGFGSSGPSVNKPAYDAVGQAISGMSSQFIDAEAPRITGPTLVDNATALFACQGVLAAIVERQRSGVARRIEVNMLDSALAFMPDPFHYFSQMGIKTDPYFRAKISQSYVFRCADDRAISVHLSSPPKFWAGFLRAIEREDLDLDGRYASREARITAYDTLTEQLRPTFLTCPAADWVARLSKEGVPCAQVYEIEEVYDDPQVQHLGCFVDLDHADMGRVNSVRRPIWIDGSRDDQPLKAPPMLGEHTEDVLLAIGLKSFVDAP